MAWFLNDLPSFNKDNFSKLRVDDPAKPVMQRPSSHCATYNTSPPPNQVIESEDTSTLLRHFYSVQAKGKDSPKRSKREAASMDGQDDCRDLEDRSNKSARVE